VVERALRELAQRVDEEEGTDVFAATCGAWQRDESPDETRRAARERFEESMERRDR